MQIPPHSSIWYSIEIGYQSLHFLLHSWFKEDLELFFDEVFERNVPGAIRTFFELRFHKESYIHVANSLLLSNLKYLLICQENRLCHCVLQFEPRMFCPCTICEIWMILVVIPLQKFHRTSRFTRDKNELRRPHFPMLLQTTDHFKNPNSNLKFYILSLRIVKVKKHTQLPSFVEKNDHVLSCTAERKITKNNRLHKTGAGTNVLRADARNATMCGMSHLYSDQPRGPRNKIFNLPTKGQGHFCPFLSIMSELAAILCL